MSKETKDVVCRNANPSLQCFRKNCDLKVLRVAYQNYGTRISGPALKFEHLDENDKLFHHETLLRRLDGGLWLQVNFPFLDLEIQKRIEKAGFGLSKFQQLCEDVSQWR